MFDRIMEELRRQRRDDHRFYHQSRINQSLHLVSAISFLVAYVLVFFHPMAAVLVGWCIGMVTRQTGHYVFEPSSYDARNQVTNAHKEAIKVGYNQNRKTVLIAVVLLSPLLLVDPTLFGVFPAGDGAGQLADRVALIWLVVAICGVVLRSVQLCATRSVVTGLVWPMKIATDPFHNIAIYWRSPLYLLRGELYDPLTDEASPAGDRVSGM